MNSSPFNSLIRRAYRRMGVIGGGIALKILSPVISKRLSSTPSGPSGESQDPRDPLSRCMTLREVLFIILILNLIDLFVLISVILLETS